MMIPSQQLLRVASTLTTKRTALCNTSALSQLFSRQCFFSVIIPPTVDVSAGTANNSMPVRFLSTNESLAVAPTQNNESIIARPPNLIFHHTVTCSPYFGLTRVTPAQPKDEPEEESYDLSTLSPTLQPQLSLPLPQRLQVNIHQFHNPFSEEEDNSANNIVGTIHLDEDVFGCSPIRTDILHRVVVYQRNKKRGKRYAAKTKTISEVRGSGKKMRPQKGTGSARCGHKRPPHWRGGAKAHGTFACQ